ncbi:MAG TPA: hypothetical protein VFC44_26095, partial [Candidatus Saccharimonadales bacterium]|nr:hypothetical protein [Candidatus Saccharimonadales bacterium]
MIALRMGSIRIPPPTGKVKRARIVRCGGNFEKLNRRALSCSGNIFFENYSPLAAASFFIR